MPRRPHTIRSRSYLPHWESPGATYSVTFRLADSLPKSVLDSYLRERRDIVETAEYMGRELSDQERERLSKLFSERIETYLDQGIGACHLKNPKVGILVFDAIKFFHPARYRLHAWCVMPNHVHALFAPTAPHTLAEIMNAWKSFTSHEANKILGRRGGFWMPEYFDHLIRDKSDFDHHCRYILDNPRKARLTNWPWVAQT